jgi:gamma-glutamyl-gamma-aminobutyraldehyde dehydrogenase
MPLPTPPRGRSSSTPARCVRLGRGSSSIATLPTVWSSGSSRPRPVVSGRPAATEHEDGPAGRPAKPSTRLTHLERGLTGEQRCGSGKPGPGRDRRRLPQADRGHRGRGRTIRSSGTRSSGPVLAVQVVSDEAEAVRVAGDTRTGLAAALWTSDLGTAHQVSRALRAGTVWVNCYEEGRHGGPVRWGQAVGIRAGQVRHALENYRPQDDLDQLWLTSPRVWPLGHADR